MLTIFLFIFLLFFLFNLKNSERIWVLISIFGAVFWITVGTYEEFVIISSNGEEFVKDQHFFMEQATSLCQSGNLLIDDIRYLFYPYFIYYSSFCLDYVSSSILAKLSFAMLWAILVGLIAYESGNKKDVHWRKIALFCIVIIGWFFSAHVLRDGFVAIGFVLVFLTYLINAGKIKKSVFLIAGLSLIVFSRPQFIPILFLAYFLILFLSFVLKYFQPYRAISLIFGLAILSLLFVPVPSQLGEVMVLYLLPHGDTAVKNTVYDIDQIALILVDGGSDASAYLFNQLITRLPSAFYGPNPLRTIVWMFSLDDIGSNYDFRLYSLAIGALTELVSWIFIALLAWLLLIDRVSYSHRLGKLYGFFWLFFLLGASLYTVKYLGFDHRIFLAFAVVLLVITVFRPPSNSEIKLIILPALLVWTLLQMAYLLIKPFDFIWNYF